MLKKLFRYDMKALSRTLLPLSLATLACGVLLLLSQLAMRFTPETGILSILMPLLFGMLIFFGSVAAILLPVVGEFFILHRYYKNLFTDEGYLTFVLPATMDEQLASKILSGFLWSFLSSITTVAALLIGFFIPTLWSDGSGLMIVRSLIAAFTAEISTVSLLILLIVSAIVSLLTQLILFYVSITLGSLLMSKHKIVGSVLFYFVTNTVSNIFSSIFATIFVFLSAFTLSEAFMLLMSLAASIVINLVLAVAGYFFILHLLKKRLNLE